MDLKREFDRVVAARDVYAALEAEVGRRTKAWQSLRDTPAHKSAVATYERTVRRKGCVSQSAYEDYREDMRLADDRCKHSEEIRRLAVERFDTECKRDAAKREWEAAQTAWAKLVTDAP